MIKRLKYREIDFEKYSQCIENSVQRNWYAQKEILDELCENWELLIKNDYEAVMPIPIKKKWKQKFVIMPLFCQQLGVFSMTDDINTNDEFYNYLNSNYLVVNYAFNSNNKFTSPVNFRNNYLINSTDYPEQKKRYFKGRKSTVKSAQNCIFKELEYSEDLRQFIDANNKGLSKESDHKKFFNYINFLENRNYLKLFGAFENETLLSLAIIISENDQLSLVALVNNEKFLKKNGASFLIDQILQKHIASKNVNFMGGNIRNIEVFFKSFGAENIQFQYLQSSYKKLIFKFIQKTFSFRNNLWMFYFLPIVKISFENTLE